MESAILISERQSENQSALAALLERKGVLEILVCALTAVAYVGTLAFGFVYDDKPAIVDDVEIRSWSFLERLFIPAATKLASPTSGTFYRPVTAVWTRLNYVFFGLNPAGWHFAMLTGHVLMTYLVFVLAAKLSSDRKVGAVAALLFGLHPVHVENVAWLSSVNDLLMSIMLVASFLAYLKFREGERWWIVISLVFFLMGLFSKETAAVFPVVVLSFAVLFGTEARRDEDSQGKWSYGSALKQGLVSLPYFAVLAVYLAFRMWILRGLVKPITGLSTKTMFLTWPAVLWFDVKHLLLPLTSSEFYSLAYVTAPKVWNFVIPICLLVVAAAAGWYVIAKLSDPRLGIFAVVWTLLAIGPTLYLKAVANENFVHDRFLYLPSVGVVILAALAIRKLSSSFGNRGVAVTAAIVAILSVAALVGTYTYQTQWANNLLLYENGVKSAPQNLVVRDNLANELANLGRYDLAIPVYLDVLQRNPNFWSSNYNLGYAYYRLGHFVEAEKYLKRAIAVDDHDADQFMILARAEMQQGEMALAAQNAERALQRNPQAAGFHLVMGKILEDSGQRERAMREYSTELLYHPENEVARGELQRLGMKQ